MQKNSKNNFSRRDFLNKAVTVGAGLVVSQSVLEAKSPKKK